MSDREEMSSLLIAIFDPSFKEFVTTRLVRFIYILGLVIGALFSVSCIAFALPGGVLFALGAVVLVTVVYLLFAMTLRVLLELIIVLFRIAENTDRMARGTEQA